jgi:GDP-L-fucose synthase
MDSLQPIYANKKILVTGGTGLIGRQLVPMLCDLGAIVTLVSLDDLTFDDRTLYLKCDLRYYEDCLRITREKDFVFHLAGIKTSPAITDSRPATMSIAPLQINTNVLEACRVNKVPKVLFTSSIGAYAQADILKEEDAYKGEPMDFLPGQVKRMAEYQIQGYEKEYGLKWVIVRLTNTYGPGDNFDPDNAMFIPSLMAKIYRGDNPVVINGDGSAVRDFAYSRDIAKGILQAMAYVKDIWPVNLGSGFYTDVKNVLETLRLLRFITRFNYEFDDSKASGVRMRVLDISKARNFGYSPCTILANGLWETWDWFIHHPEEYKERKNYFIEDGSRIGII